MVNLWPFGGGDDKSAENFEKRLSDLTRRIARTNNSRDVLRVRQRRFKALWTLWTFFAWTVYALIIFLVQGRDTWTLIEYTILIGGFTVILAVRAGLHGFFKYLIQSCNSHIRDLQKQKAETIEKFKEATKYNSTQQLLEKYGAAEKSDIEDDDDDDDGDSNNNSGEAQERPRSKRGAHDAKDTEPKRAPPSVHMPQRTGLPPPPTANIQRPVPQPAPVPPQPQPGPQSSPPPHPQNPVSPLQMYGEEFLPNTAKPQYGHREWYDRLIDVFLGEDETKAVNRLALICQHCKLVNGQAPPGIKSLDELGRWRCAECRKWNGVSPESEVDRIVKQVKGDASAASRSGSVSDEPERKKRPSVPDVRVEEEN